ncbi:DUF1285 domain-containing protein [Pseudomonadota bacterium]
MTNKSPSVGVEKLAKSLTQQGLPPIHKWDPPFCGDIDIRITRDGNWFYQGSRITRIKLARLFSTVLRREKDQHYYLVTPVEKLRIIVDDVPFVAIDVEVSGHDETQQLTFLTNLDDKVTVDKGHPLWVDIDRDTGEPSPYVRVRDNLDALISKSVYYRLVDLGRELTIDEVPHLGLTSCGQFFSLGFLE